MLSRRMLIADAAAAARCYFADFRRFDVFAPLMRQLLPQRGAMPLDIFD